jgi:hypothetical protein
MWILIITNCLSCIQLPQSPWSEDRKLKELGMWHQENVLDGVGAYSYALFSRVLNWQRVEIEVLLAGVRREVKDLSLHLYTTAHFIYGQKPNE